MTRILRRLLRFTVFLLCLMSLLVCVGTSWLWRRSHRSDRDRFSFRRADSWYSVVSEGGRVRLFGPPPPSTSAGTRKRLDDLASRLRNDQFVWRARVKREGDSVEIMPAAWGWV